jgi:hypothetical protein
MTRQMDRSLRMLAALRKERGAREATEAAFNTARTWFEMPREAPSGLDFGGDPPPGPAAEPDPAPEAAVAPEVPVSPAALAKAVQFASRNRMLAARIRAAGGLTRTAIAGFRPGSLPDAETVEALVHGGDLVLAALDRRKDAA